MLWPVPAAASLIRELVRLPAAETFKADDRSTVWRVDAPAGPYVLKRYEYAPFRQQLGLWTNLHPGQRERRGSRRLRRAGIDVAAPAAWERVGGRYVQASRYAGACLQARIGEPAWRADDAKRAAVLTALAAAAAALLHAGLVHRDLKVGNVLVTDEGAVRLIDVGAVRRSRSLRRRRATLRMLLMTLRKAGGTDDDAAALRERLVERGVPRAWLP